MEIKSKDRLIKLLNMLSSQHDGEVLAAANAINEMLKRENTSWSALIALPKPPETPKIDDVAIDPHECMRMMNDIMKSPFVGTRTMIFINGLMDYMIVHKTLTQKQYWALRATWAAV